MKKLRIVFFSLFVFAGLCSQTTPLHYAHIPANAGVNNMFFHDNLCHKFLFIYTQAEIAAMVSPVSGPVLIDTIWFRHGGSSSDPNTILSNLIITLGHTTLNAPVPNFANNFNAGAPVTVLNSPAYTYTPLIGNWNQVNHNWTYIVLQVPFQYNFTDNLAVQFEFSASSGFIVGHYADNGGIPYTQYDVSNSAVTASATTARPMFGISPGCGAPVSLGADTIVCGQNSFQLNAAAPNANYAWSTGATTSNITVTTSGTYWVTVTDTCGSRSDTIVVNLNPNPVANAGNDQSVCAGQTIQINASGGTSYSWSPSAGLSSTTISNPQANPATTTTYVVTATTNGCSSTDTVIVLVNPLPVVSAGSDTTIIYGASVQLNASGNYSYSWQGSNGLSCTSCPAPVASPSVTTNYTVTATDTNGCSATDEITVIVDLDCGEVFVPEAFSPNEDAKNDSFCVYGNCITGIDLRIYDRWGTEIFHSEDKDICWDGKIKGQDAVGGVYVYQLKAILITGTEISKKGTVHLIR